MTEEYRLVAHTGDVVQMLNGVIGIINDWGIFHGGHIKLVHVHPFTNWLHRLFLVLTGKLWFGEEQINKLKPLCLAPRP